MMGIYPQGLAALHAEAAGEKYRPANGTEGDFFRAEYCDQCQRHSYQAPCQICGSTFFLDVDDEEYPVEWQYGSDGQPMCTAFQRRAA
jgi:hypothetical protein